ncbi:glycosyltransferase [Agrococcus terreus]|uniref:glycosyltransferase family protein n=1 Tax=Agrococcus terreus TaxID=574649 RepID=UPI00384D2FDA
MSRRAGAAAAGGCILVVVLCAAGWALEGPWLALLIAVVLLAAAVVMVAQRRSAARALAATRSLERAVRASRSRTTERSATPTARVDARHEESSGTADQVLEARILDRDHYSAVAGRVFSSDREAAEHLLAHGMAKLLAPNALLQPEMLPAGIRQRYASGDLAAVLAFLRRAPATMPALGSSFSPSMVEAPADVLRAHPGGALGWFLEHADDRDLMPTTKLHARWGQFRTAIAEARRVHAGEREAADAPGRVRRRCSLVVLDRGDAAATTQTVVSAMAAAGHDDVEVLVALGTTSLEHRIALAALLSGETRARVVEASPDDLSAMVALAGGEVVCLALEPVRPRAGWSGALRRALDESGVAAVQPLVLRGDDSIDGAGLTWGADAASVAAVLAGRPPEDAARVASLDLRSFSGPVVAARAESLREASIGVDGSDADLAILEIGLRLRAGGGRLRCAVGAVVERPNRPHVGSLPLSERARPLLERCEQELAALATADAPPDTVGAGCGPRTRWGIRLASTGGAAGDRWGDTAFASSLGDALRRMGCEVVTYRHGANERVHEMLDDVSVVIRGKDRLAPVPGAINVLWVISHPGDISDEELASFDLVYAASTVWAAERSESSGIPIGVLLQCTDATRFGPDGPAGPERPAVFVGSVHPGRRRAVVADAMAAGVDLRVIGGGWQRVLPPEVLEAVHVPNERLADVYRSADVVLADHWRAMADGGFIQNRVFDALACAAPVVSDPVVGMEAALGGAVAEYRTLDDLRGLCDGSLPHPAGDRSSRERIARHVLGEHSFDARARTLVDAVAPRIAEG